MKKIALLIIITFTINSFSQTPDNKTLIADMNNFYNKGKTEKLEVITTEILSGKYGVVDDELKFYALMYSSNVYSSDEYANKDAQKGYNKLFDLLDFAKKTSYQIPNKEAYIKSMSDYLITYKNKHPEVKESVKEIENNAVAEIKAETVKKTKEINTTEANLTPQSTSDDKTVTLTVSGTGKTLEEAKLNALRSAIEQAFGAFISSKTEILNDNVVKDEIISVSNGSIQKFNIVSEVEIPNTGFATTLNATVSVSKLTTFVESKGVIAEFKGSLFSFNIKQQILNENNEVKAINDLCETVKQIFDKSVDYEIAPENPVALDNTNQNWSIKLNIRMSINNNILSIADYMYKTLNDISMSKTDVINYKNLGKITFPISFASDEKSFCYIVLRKEESLNLLINMIKYFDKSAVDFNVLNGNSTINMKDNFPDFNAISKSLILLKHDNNDKLAYIEIPETSTNLSGGAMPFIYVAKRNNAVFTNQFEFIKNLLKNYEYNTRTKRSDGNPANNLEIKTYNPGTIISFLLFRIPSGNVKLQYSDKRTLDEINKITEYKISKK